MYLRQGKIMRFFILIAVLALAVSLMSVAACGESDDNTSGTIRPGGDTSYKIVFDAGDGVRAPDPIVLTGSASLVLPENLSRPGYSFEGWYVDEDYETSLRDFLMNNAISEDITAYAKWEAIEYRLTAAVSNGNAGEIIFDGKAAEVHTALFNYGDRFSLEAVSRPEKAEYYTFIGWYDADGNQVQGSTDYEFTAGAADIDLEARWRGAQLKIFFHNEEAVNDGDKVSEVTDFRYGDTFTYVPDFADDSVFEGWSYVKTGGAPATDGDGKFDSFEPDEVYLDDSVEQGIAYELHLFAQWSIAKTDLEYGKVDGGYSVNGWKDAEYEEGSAPESLRIPGSFSGHRIVSVSGYAFENYEGSVFVPGSVTDIAENAFGSGTKVYFDADVDYGSVASVLDGIGSENIYFNLLSGLKAKAEYPDTFNYPVYVESAEGIFDTDIGSKEEFIEVYRYCWLYNVGSMNLNGNSNGGGTYVEFDFSGSGLAPDKILCTVLGLDRGHRTESGWVNEAIEEIGLKSNTAPQYAYIYQPETAEYKLTIMFKDLSESNIDYSYVASEGTYEIMQLQSSAAFAGEVSDPYQRSLPIDSLPEYVVYNSEQLIYAVENGFKPRFGTLSADAPQHEKNALASAKISWKEAREILYSINSAGDSDFEKLLNIHDYIALNVIYDSELLERSKTSSAAALSGYRGFNLEGVLIDKLAVCDGITKAFMLMARMEGVDCVRITGKNAGGIGHAWNKVKLGNTWYNVDVTGDDIPTSGISGASCAVEVLTHDKFLVSDDYLSSKGYREDDYGYVKASGNYDFYDFVTPEALQGIENSDGDLSVSDKAEMNAVLLAAIAEAKKIFVADPDADYVTFDIYWDSDSMLTSTVDLNYQYIPLSGQTEYSSKGAYAIVISKENVSEFEF